MTAKNPKSRKIGEARTVYRATPHSRILSQCKKTLAQTYGERLKGVILYGSMARKQAAPTSDIDLLVLLAPPLDYFAELRRIVDVLYPLQLESKHLISAKPVSVNDYEAGSISLYRNAKREGVAV
jgi:predicted nucleotidyltransferase